MNNPDSAGNLANDSDAPPAHRRKTMLMRLALVVGLAAAAWSLWYLLFERGMAMPVIGGALLRIHQDLIGFVDLFEFDFRFRIARIAVRMKFHGEFAEGHFDVRFRRGARHA